MSLATFSLYVADDWTFDLVATDGSLGVGDIVIVNGGTGYTVPPVVVFSAPPIGGRIAAATAVVVGGQLTGVVITDPGIYAPGAPPMVAFGGGGGFGALGLAVLGNPIDLTGCTLGAEVFQANVLAATDISSSVAVTIATRGQFSVNVPRTLTGTFVGQSPIAKVFPTRLHVFYTDHNGRRKTIAVIPIIPVAP